MIQDCFTKQRKKTKKQKNKKTKKQKKNITRTLIACFFLVQNI
jgi:hypothetical protein